MECNSNRAAVARFYQMMPFERARVGALAMAGVLVSLVMWNVFLLAFAFVTMPCNDFGRPLMATQAFLHGNDMYGDNEAVQYRFNNQIIRLWNLNPPHSHLLYVPLAVLPSWLALAAWFVLSGLCLYLSIWIIVSEVGVELTRRRREWMLLWLLSFTAMGVAIVTAHLAFPLMLLMTLAWRDARRGGWGKAGCWLGVALSIKPFLLIFVPYLTLKGCWRGLAGVGASTAAAFLVGFLIFGVESHRSWLQMLSRADSWAWLPLNASLYGVISRVLIENPMFTTVATVDPGWVRMIWLVVGIPVGLVALLRAVSVPIVEGADRAFAILLVSAVLLSPLGWIYYFWLPVGPIAAIAHGWWVEHERNGSGARSVSGSASKYLFAVSMVVMTFPSFLLRSFQPSVLATFVIGSLPFWSLSLVWLALMLDGLDARGVRAWIGSMWAAWMAGRWTDRKLVSGSP